jgi:hypothetical protein
MGVADRLLRLCGELGMTSPRGLYSFMVRQVFREWNAYGLRRDLTVPWSAPPARIPLVVRELRDDDMPHIFEVEGGDCSRRARLERMHRLAFLAERVQTPYVAIDVRRDRPCFLQWLMTAAENDTIQRYFRGRFPPLAADEALLEYAYTPAFYRGNGIMPAAMAMIAERASELGVRYVLTFVLRENSAALKGCSKAGFSPFVIRRDRHYAFRLIRRRSFVPLKGSADVREKVLIPQMLTEG